MKKTITTLSLIALSSTVSHAALAWINEIDYDQPGADSGEFVEVFVSTSFAGNLSDLAVTLYNGSNSTSYGSDSLDTFTPGATIAGVGTYYSLTYAANGLQNGVSDGMALSNNGTLISFLSYEGTLTGSGGVADGVVSTDVGVAESNGDDPNESLFLTGTGSDVGDFTWSEGASLTLGAANTGQTITAVPEPSSIALLGLGGLATLLRRKR